MRILIVEDSERLAQSLKRGLKKCGFAADAVGDGRQGLSYATKEPYDVIVLDLMLPEMHGLEVLRRLREDGKDTPVIILTALDAVDDRVRGLREGADDYLVKPFSFDELLARIEALNRRRSGQVNPIIEIGDLTIDTAARHVRHGDESVPLNAREYALLLYLASRRGETISRIEIEDHLYGEDNFPMSNAVPSAISTLRARLAAHGVRDVIHTRRGLGYV
ncbi:MAG: response regulator transcription factor, partial [Planctomycetes bacterium]|nr:response regulator transcription factor [Planctomycetota bacterium]